ncbi:hypothetical protein Ddye_016821 [Dipteronia dyeriana]|uniref:NB-ARC domain-containing protein n=1 Tax=Dipteronia dyeriana TaxID=168575 RepID=A0AAD9U8D8_9ROSI|nr:hypothetical protein Ddye_016821 [Dipteronia dyeriana]
MDFLLFVRENGTEIPIIAIAGMDGVGKTMLAQLLYNECEEIFQNKSMGICLRRI